MTKRRGLLPSPSKKSKYQKNEGDKKDDGMCTARGRLKGALQEVLDPDENSDTSYEQSPSKKERTSSHEAYKESDSEDDSIPSRNSQPRQSYVLKLFDRSVDLSQFTENSPLYPICRAWMTNQPKLNYNTEFGKLKEEPEHTINSVTLPGPEGLPVSKIPDLIPEQMSSSKDNINLNYKECVPLSREQLILWHTRRWAGIRRAWLQQGALAEKRYAATQRSLNKMSFS